MLQPWDFRRLGARTLANPRSSVRQPIRTLEGDVGSSWPTDGRCRPTTRLTCRSGRSRALLLLRTRTPPTDARKARARHGPQVNAAFDRLGTSQPCRRLGSKGADDAARTTCGRFHKTSANRGYLQASAIWIAAENGS